MTTVRAVLRQIESLGYLTSVHRMGEYVEMHAVPRSDLTQLVLVRDGDGDDEEACYRCARHDGQAG